MAMKDFIDELAKDIVNEAKSDIDEKMEKKQTVLITLCTRWHRKYKVMLLLLPIM